MQIGTKSKIILTSLSIFILISVLFIFVLSSLQEKNINGKVIQETAGLSLLIVSNKESAVVPASGNLTFSNDFIDRRITTITNLIQGVEINISLEGVNYPQSWTESPPNSSIVGNKIIEYFELSVNESVPSGVYPIYFNVTPAELGNLPAENISLFHYDGGWENLSTFVLNGTSNPAAFYAVAEHFSKFMIAELPSRNESVTPTPEQPGASAGNGGSSGGGGSSGKITAIVPPEKEVPEIGPTGLKPVHLPGNLFDVSLIIPQKYREIMVGEEIISEISIINIQKKGFVPVNLEYSIEDVAGQVFFREIDTKVVDDEEIFIKKINVPTDIPEGDYLFMVRLKYGNDTAIAGYPFKIIVKTQEKVNLFGLAISFSKENISYLTLLLFFLAVIILFLLYFKARKSMYLAEKQANARNKLSEIKTSSPRQDSSGQKFLNLSDESISQGKLKTLKEAYDEKYIDKKSFEEVKKMLKPAKSLQKRKKNG